MRNGTEFAADGTRLCFECKTRPARWLQFESGEKWGRCAECQAEYMRWYNIQRKYGLNKEQYLDLLDRQGGTCALCDSTIDLVVDHDHETGQVRGILCRIHNVAIGVLGDTHESIRRALDYLAGSRV